MTKVSHGTDRDLNVSFYCGLNMNTFLEFLPFIPPSLYTPTCLKSSFYFAFFQLSGGYRSR